MKSTARCRWCGMVRGIIMIGEEDSGVLLCANCDYAANNAAGPPIDPTQLRSPEATP